MIKKWAVRTSQPISFYIQDCKSANIPLYYFEKKCQEKTFMIVKDSIKTIMFDVFGTVLFFPIDREYNAGLKNLRLQNQRCQIK